MNIIYNRIDKKNKRRKKMSKEKKLNNVLWGRILIKNRSGYNIYVEAIKPKECETIKTSYFGLVSTEVGATQARIIRSKALVLNDGVTGEVFDIQVQHLVNKNETCNIWNYIYFTTGLLFYLFVICLT